jgi:hypothetical protein
LALALVAWASAWVIQTTVGAIVIGVMGTVLTPAVTAE